MAEYLAASAWMTAALFAWVVSRVCHRMAVEDSDEVGLATMQLVAAWLATFVMFACAAAGVLTIARAV